MAESRSLRGLFERVGRGGTIERDEIQAYLEELGAGKGLLGKVKIKAAIAIFMARFDKDPKDGGVSWKEMLDNAGKLIPAELVSAKGEIDVARAKSEYAKYAGASGDVGYDELKAYVDAKLPSIIPSNLADALARFAMDALDVNDDGRITWTEVETVLGEYNREIIA